MDIIQRNRDYSIVNFEQKLSKLCNGGEQVALQLLYKQAEMKNMLKC